MHHKVLTGCITFIKGFIKRFGRKGSFLKIKHGWGSDLVHELLLGIICSEKLCVEKGDQHRALPEGRTQALSIHQYHATITNICHIMVCNRTQKALNDDEMRLVASGSMPADSVLSAHPHVAAWAQEALWGPSSRPEEDCPIPEHSGMKQHFKTCLRGSGEEATGCKLSAERNGCLDTEASSTSQTEVDPYV